MKIILILPVLLILISCSAREKVDELSLEFKEKYENLPNYETLSAKKLSWHDALNMLDNNPEYRKAKQEVKNAQFRIGKTWRDLIPILDIGHYYNAPLKWSNNADTYNDFNINVFFSLPQLINMPIEHYTNSLMAIKADTAARMKKRELEAKLYELFKKYRLLEHEIALSHELNIKNEAEKKEKQKGFEAKKRALWLQLARLTNDYSARWIPDCSDLPKVRLNKYQRLAKSPDKLFLATLALEHEASRLRKLGVFIRFLPSPHLNFYSPTLFSSSGGELGGFMKNADDIRVNLNTYVQLDTKGEIYHDYQIAKEDHELTAQSLTQKMMEHKEKIHRVLKSWEEYEEWKRTVNEYVAFKNKQGVSSAKEGIELQKESLEIEKLRLDQETSNLERECAFIQEYGWGDDA